jgi:hypothetical protein
MPLLFHNSLFVTSYGCDPHMVSYVLHFFTGPEDTPDANFRGKELRRGLPNFCDDPINRLFKYFIDRVVTETTSASDTLLPSWDIFIPPLRLLTLSSL